MPSTAFTAAFGFDLYSIRARSCCIVYFKSRSRFCRKIRFDIEQLKQRNPTHSFTQVNLSGISKTEQIADIQGERYILLYSVLSRPPGHYWSPQKELVHIVIGSELPSVVAVSNSMIFVSLHDQRMATIFASVGVRTLNTASKQPSPVATNL